MVKMLIGYLWLNMVVRRRLSPGQRAEMPTNRISCPAMRGRCGATVPTGTVQGVGDHLKWLAMGPGGIWPDVYRCDYCACNMTYNMTDNMLRLKTMENNIPTMYCQVTKHSSRIDLERCYVLWSTVDFKGKEHKFAHPDLSRGSGSILDFGYPA